MSKSNSFVKFLKNINNSISSFLEQNLNKLNFNNFVNITRSNKFFLTFVALIILLLSYLSIPNVYNQYEISKELRNNLLEEFKLDLNFSQNLNYSFFPRPHFTINESTLSFKKNKISQIKKIKIYVSLENLFSLKNIKIKNLELENANFEFKKENQDFFLKLLDNNFQNQRINIKNSNIFYRNSENEVLFINKILEMKYFYDSNESKNIMYSKNKIFNMPYSIEIFDKKDEKKLYSKLNLNFLRLQIDNQYNYKDKLGAANLIHKKLKSTIIYEKNKNSFNFDFFDKTDKPEFLYKAKFHFKPFYSNLNGNLEKLNLFYLFDPRSIIVQLLKTEIFKNKNLNFLFNLKANKILNYNNLVNIVLNSKIEEGLIDIDNSKFEWKNYAKFELSNTLIFVKNGELILDGTSKINIVDYKSIYKFLLTPKNLRKKIKKIDLNYTYNFDKKIISVNDIKIDNKFNQKVNKSINNILIKNNDLQNKIYFKKLLNEAIKSYAG